MGLWDFVSGVGKKLGIDHFEEAARLKKVDDEAARLQAERAAIDKMNATLTAAVAGLGVAVDDLKVFITPQKVVKVSGRAQSQADKEKVIQLLGNHAGVDAVDDSGLSAPVKPDEPPGVFHTVQKGDTLSKIAQRYYGIIHAYPVIADANQHLIKDVDKVEPGWILRIPAIQAIAYRTKQGDTLSLIAKHMYGDMMKYPKIAEANPTIIKNVDVVEPNWTLAIPILQPLPAGAVRVA